METVNVKGIRLSARFRASGPGGLVFIHGLGAAKDSFDRAFEERTLRGFSLFSLDLPGCGASESPEDFSYSMEDQADLVEEAVAGLGLESIILVGHSMGGVIGLILAERAGPPGVRAFFNLEGNLSGDDCMFSMNIASLTEEEFVGRGFGGFRDDLRHTVQKSPSPGLMNYLENIERASPRALWRSSASLVEESLEGDLGERFAGLDIDKYYVFGERSRLGSTERFLDSRLIPQFTVPESGHFMMDDNPEGFYRMLGAGLSGIAL